MSRSTFSFSVALALAACTPTPAAAPAAPDPAAVRATIESTEKQWSAAYLKGDGTAVAALYAEDGASVQPSGDWSRGRVAIAKQVQSELDSVNVATREDITEEVTMAGDYAVEIGHYAWTGKAKKSGAARSANGRYMVVWRKDADGTWRLFRDIGTPGTLPKK